MLYKILHSVALVMVILLNSGCATSDSVSQPENTHFPDKIVEFHNERSVSYQSVFILTTYKVPFDGSFWFTQLLENDTMLSAYVQYWGEGEGRKIRFSGELTTDEKERLLSALYSIPIDILGESQSGEFVLTLSLSKPNSDEYGVISCMNSNCPVELCLAYDITHALAIRIGADIIDLSCPITSN